MAELEGYIGRPAVHCSHHGVDTAENDSGNILKPGGIPQFSQDSAEIILTTVDIDGDLCLSFQSDQTLADTQYSALFQIEHRITDCFDRIQSRSTFDCIDCDCNVRNVIDPQVRVKQELRCRESCSHCSRYPPRRRRLQQCFRGLL